MNLTLYRYTWNARYFVAWHMLACACCGRDLVAVRIWAGLN